MIRSEYERMKVCVCVIILTIIGTKENNKKKAKMFYFFRGGGGGGGGGVEIECACQSDMIILGAVKFTFGIQKRNFQRQNNLPI